LTDSLTVEKFLTSSEKEVVNAVVENPSIYQLTQLEPEGVNRLFRQTIAKCLVITGIKSELDDATIAILWNYIKTTFNHSTFQEIEKAVYFNTSGKFDTRIEHYQSFNLEFLSQVMEQWLIFKTKTRQRIQTLLPKPEPEKITTDQESYNGLVEYCKKNKEFPDFWAWSKVYQHMEECLMIEMTIEQKKELFASEVKRLKSKLELDILDTKDAIERQERMDGIPEAAKLECRKKMIKKYLKY